MELKRSPYFKDTLIYFKQFLLLQTKPAIFAAIAKQMTRDSAPRYSVVLSAFSKTRKKKIENRRCEDKEDRWLVSLADILATYGHSPHRP
jgi:hypothetical protein